MKQNTQIKKSSQKVAEFLENNNLHKKDFAEMILQKLCTNGFTKDKVGEYLVLCEPYLKNPYQIYRLIECCLENNQVGLCKYLYKKFWDINIKLERKYWLNDSYGYKHVFCGDYWFTKQAWNKCCWVNDKEIAKELLIFFKSH